MNTDYLFPPFKYDLDLTDDIEMNFDREVVFPVELMETDTSFTITPPVAEQAEETIHVKLYDISVDTANTLTLDPLPPICGSENFLGGSENLG